MLATCDMIGKVVFGNHDIIDNNKHTWQLQANRRIMPSRWTLTDPNQTTVMQFDQKMLAKLTNPLYRVVMTMLDANDQERYRVVDPRTFIPDLLLAANTTDWAIMKDEKVKAKICTLKTRTKPARGLLGKIQNLLTTADHGIISADNEHLFAPPLALAMFMLNQELTDIRGA